MYDNAVGYVHNVLTAVLQQGDVAVDATIGNGWDTAVMGELVGRGGTVYGFDIQDVALEVTRARTSECLATIKLFQQGHQTLATVVDAKHHGQVKAVSFNLGYLPGGDKNLTTHVETTLEGLTQAVSILASDGVITVVCYRHAEGVRELNSVREFVKGLPQDQYTTVEVDFINQRGTPPIVFVVTARPKELPTIESR